MSHLYRREGGTWVPRAVEAVYRKENGQWIPINYSDLAVSKYLHKAMYDTFRYVSLGDSIAVGHRIDDNWERDYGWNKQYGVWDKPYTEIVPGCYADLIRNELVDMYGAEHVSLTSFAKSGDTVGDLMKKLDHQVVRDAIAIADLVTICIGANDVLTPVLHNISDYINTGSLDAIISTVETNLNTLANDSASTSYMALFNKLYSINQNAKFVFTTIYNPYKYLWIEEGKNGFFKPVLDSIPQMTFIGIEVDEKIKDGLLSTDIVRTLFSRVNGLCDYAENFVTRLNTVLRNKLASYGNGHFMLADTKAVYDPVPDRPIPAPKHYNDLLNVEYTRSYDTAKMDWGRLWAGSNVTDYWTNMALSHVSLEKGFDIMGFARDLVPQIVERVIEPDIDPHPERYGQYALKCSFADALGWSELPRRTIAYRANGGTGSMNTQTVVALDDMTAYVNINANAFKHASAGYYWTGWKDAGGASYSNGQFIGLSGDLVLYAQWSNLYTVTFRHSYDSKGNHGSSDTGPQQNYALWIDGAEQGDLGAFSNNARTYRLPYGTPIGVVAQVNAGSGRSYVTWNGVKVAGSSSDARYQFNLTCNVDIHFEWNWFLGDISQFFATQSYWNCYITTV